MCLDNDPDCSVVTVRIVWSPVKSFTALMCMAGLPDCTEVTLWTVLVSDYIMNCLHMFRKWSWQFSSSHNEEIYLSLISFHILSGYQKKFVPDWRWSWTDSGSKIPNFLHPNLWSWFVISKSCGTGIGIPLGSTTQTPTDTTDTNREKKKIPQTVWECDRHHMQSKNVPQTPHTGGK
jgi:hypothetical protein